VLKYYIFRNTSSTFILLFSGQGCLEVSYHMTGKPRLGTLAILGENKRPIFRTNRDRGDRWVTKRLNVLLSEGTTASSKPQVSADGCLYTKYLLLYKLLIL